MRRARGDPELGPEFVYSSFRLAQIRFMPLNLQLLSFQGVSETHWAILVSLADGPESLRGLELKLKYLARNVRGFKRLKTSRKTVAKYTKELAKVGFVDGPRMGKGSNYRLSRVIIPFFIKGLKENLKNHGL